MLPVVASIGLFGPMIVAAIYLIWRRRRGKAGPAASGQRPPAPKRTDDLVRELSQNHYRR